MDEGNMTEGQTEQQTSLFEQPSRGVPLLGPPDTIMVLRLAWSNGTSKLHSVLSLHEEATGMSEAETSEVPTKSRLVQQAVSLHKSSCTIFNS